MGLSGEEYEMLIGFDKKYLQAIGLVADECNMPLTVFARVASNTNRFECLSHHF